MRKQTTPKDIDDYVSRFPIDIQKVLQKVRMTVKKAAPRSKETIKYGMPTFTLGGNLVYFAAFSKHIGFYPRSTGSAQLDKQLAPYASGRGSLKFPLDEPMPYDLIRKIVKVRAEHLTGDRS